MSDTTQARKDIALAEAMANPSVCPDCNHPPIMHETSLIGDNGWCLVCLGMRKSNPIIRVCKNRFKFKLTQAEREQATKADPTSYPQGFIAQCANCHCYWEQHHGYLCPTGDSTFILLII